MDVKGTVPEVINCHACGTVIDLAGQTAFTHVDCPHCGAISVVPVQFGNFLLLNPLGIGGMGTVYKAVDLSLNRYLALKILRPKLASHPEFIENFAREARAAAAVNHPNIAQVYSFGEHEGQYYLAMELLERGSLDDRMTTLGKLPEKDILEIGYQVASGLRAAEQRGLLHRDIKPGNILFNDDGVPKIVDFGLARAQAQEEKGNRGNEPIWGTPYYIAPEKLRGQPEDLRSDIYSLGATLYHALAARPPFDAATAGEVITKHATQPAYSLKTYAPGVHERTARIMGRMLSKNPAERYATYDELLHDIYEAQEILRTEENRKVVVVSGGEKIPLTSIIVTIIAVVIGALAVLFVWYKLFRAPPSEPAALPPPGVTSTVATTRSSAAAPSEGVDFNDNTPWGKSWNTAMLQLAQGNYEQALITYEETLRLLGPQRLQHRRWIFYMEGLTLLWADQPTDARQSFLKALNPAAPRLVPLPVTTSNLIDPLAFVMVGDLPPVKLEEALPQMPAWAQALSLVSLGFRHLENGDLNRAIDSFGRYQQLAPAADQRWVYRVQPLTDKLTRQCEQVRTVLGRLDQLAQEQKYPEALARLREIQRGNPPSLLRPLLTQREAPLQAGIKKQQDQQAQLQAEQERQRQAQAERERQRVAEETKALQSIEPDLAPLWQVYDFHAAALKYEAFEQTLQTAGGKQAVEQRIATTRLLEDFKKQLQADFPKHPYPGETMTTRDGVQPIGQLVRASETKLVFATQFGEMIKNWRDFAPTELIRLAASYLAVNAATEKPEQQAHRYLLLAAFCKQYDQDQLANSYAQQAVRLDPALHDQLAQIVGPLKGN